jgi:hypothetical protein
VARLPLDWGLFVDPPMLWLQRWNFVARARLERELWEAFEAGRDIEAMVAESGRVAATDPAERLRHEVWQTTCPRIRRIEAMMRNR